MGRVKVCTRPQVLSEEEVTPSADGAAALSATISPLIILGIVTPKMLTGPLALAFVKESVGKWPAGAYKFTAQLVSSRMISGEERFCFLVVWSAPTPTLPVPPVVVNMTAEVWLTEEGPILGSIKCKCIEYFITPVHGWHGRHVFGCCPFAVERESHELTASGAASGLEATIKKYIKLKGAAVGPLTGPLGLLEPFEKDRLP